MNGLALSRRTKIILIVALAVAALTLPTWLSQFYVQLSTRSLFLGVVAMSFILLAGYGGMISLAQMSFFAMAGYVIGIGWKTYDASYLVTIPLAIAAAAALSAAFGLIAIRASGIYFLVMTLALGQLFQGVALQWASVTGGYNGIAGIEPPVLFGVINLRHTSTLYYVTLAVALVSYLLMRRLVHSPFGITLQGIRDNPKRMAAMGFNVQQHRFLVIVISGLFAGVAGAVAVFYNGVIAPDTADLEAAVVIVMAALVGGVAKLEGGILGAFITVFLVNLSSQVTLRYWTLVGIVFVLIVMFMPDGLLGGKLPGRAMLRRWRERVRLRRAG
ncbi:MAG: branched-chain amino acid ABC transporter permease [Anaerolineae bacterium]